VATWDDTAWIGGTASGTSYISVVTSYLLVTVSGQLGWLRLFWQPFTLYCHICICMCLYMYWKIQSSSSYLPFYHFISLPVLLQQSDPFQPEKSSFGNPTKLPHTVCDRTSQPKSSLVRLWAPGKYTVLKWVGQKYRTTDFHSKMYWARNPFPRELCPCRKRRTARNPSSDTKWIMLLRYMLVKRDWEIWGIGLMLSKHASSEPGSYRHANNDTRATWRTIDDLNWLALAFSSAQTEALT